MGQFLVQQLVNLACDDSGTLVVGGLMQLIVKERMEAGAAQLAVAAAAQAEKELLAMLEVGRGLCHGQLQGRAESRAVGAHAHRYRG